MAMVKAPFNGQLNSNEIFSAIYNMIISQDMMYPELNNNYGELINKFRVDGTLYGDTKLYYAMDVLKTRNWLNDSEASNLLNINRPASPKCQAITIDTFRQIDITVDQYLSKRAWSTEGAFSSFNSVILGMLEETKTLHDTNMFNTYVGITEGASNKATVEVDLSSISATGEEKNRLEAQTISQAIADLLVDMKKYSRDYNDYKFMRAYSESQLIFIVNSKWINKITKLDLPTIFHTDGLTSKLTENILPCDFFGEKITSGTIANYVYNASTNPTGTLDVSGGIYSVHTGIKSIRTVEEGDYAKSGGADPIHLFAGEIVPAGYIVTAGNIYQEDPDIIAKVVTKDTFKFMSAFSTGTEFWNPRSLTSNHYITWGYSYPDRLLDKPLVTIKAD